jgi:hypothetical protein
MDRIDFVLPWVDGNDKSWNALKSSYERTEQNTFREVENDANAEWRYRDNGWLKYWFRSVERFTPWVNRVFFVTCGQKPEWLDESNPKLCLVDHKDYIPADYLPTFQSNPIELNLHRIADLSERFVLFNDDMFLLRPLKPEFFFKNGLPVIPCDLGIPYWLSDNQISHTVINNCGVLKRSINVKHLLWKNIGKYIDVRALGFKCTAKNFLSFAINKTIIPGSFGHLPQSHLKSTLDEIWRTQPDVMDKVSRYRFRNNDCVNHWLACAWNMVSGRFYPVNEKRKGVFVGINTGTLPLICEIIENGLHPQICLCDKGNAPDLGRCMDEITRTLDKLLPDKSSFEK